MTDVEQIEAVLRSDVAEPSPAFAADLDRRGSEGFPKPARRPRPWLRPALAAGAVVVVAAIAVIGTRVQQEHKISESFKGAPPALLSRAAPPDATLSAAAPRRVERDVQLTIAAPQDKLQQAADGVGTVAESHHGFVSSSHVTTGDAGASGGSFELRVPQRELQSTIADLSKLGELRSRSESAQDLTAPYGRTQDRLGNALVERRTLKLRSRTAAIRARIVELSVTIDRLGARL